jgi:hydroxymethylpyrimidine pyrophosphatase-like HAD family hydrolase
MKSSEIINYLEENDLADVEEIKQKGNYVIIRFYYDFDKEELGAAKAYSNEESDFESESDEWYSEYYIPYLRDIAVDNVESVMEEIMDEFEVESKYKEFGMENGESGYFKFLAAFSDELTDAEMEDILNDYYE